MISIKRLFKKLKWMVDNAKVVIAIYTFLAGLLTYTAYDSNEKSNLIKEMENNTVECPPCDKRPINKKIIINRNNCDMEEHIKDLH